MFFFKNVGLVIQKKWSNGELRPYEKIRSKIANEFDIYGKGSTTYY